MSERDVRENVSYSERIEILFISRAPIQQPTTLGFERTNWEDPSPSI